MKNRILLFFLISFGVSIMGALLKMNGMRDLGNGVMLVGAGMQLVILLVWLFSQRSKKSQGS